jgi:hypothetical protein
MKDIISMSLRLAARRRYFRVLSSGDRVGKDIQTMDENVIKEGSKENLTEMRNSF